MITQNFTQSQHYLKTLFRTLILRNQKNVDTHSECVSTSTRILTWGHMLFWGNFWHGHNCQSIEDKPTVFRYNNPIIMCFYLHFTGSVHLVHRLGIYMENFIFNENYITSKCNDIKLHCIPYGNVSTTSQTKMVMVFHANHVSYDPHKTKNYWPHKHH